MAEYYLISHGIIVIASWVSFCSYVILEICGFPHGGWVRLPFARCSDDQILDDESEGMRIVAHPNENITRHLSENALFIES